MNNIDALRNWWKTQIDIYIQELIWDKFNEGADSIYTCKVIYVPYETTLIDKAGIKH